MRSSITFDQFKANPKFASKLARQRNGVAVVDENGTRLFSVWIPKFYCDSDAEALLTLDLFGLKHHEV